MELFSTTSMRLNLGVFLFEDPPKIEQSVRDAQLHATQWAHQQVYAELHASHRPYFYWTGRRDAVEEADAAWRHVFE